MAPPRNSARPAQHRRRILLAWLAGLTMLNTGALAAGLGKGQLKSLLGQALEAEFEILGESSEQLSERCFRIVKPLDRDFEAEDIVRGSLTLERNTRDQQILRLRSNTLVSEPIINITLQMSCGSSPFIRKYTFLPEIPARSEARAEATPPVAAVTTAATAAEAPHAAGTKAGAGPAAPAASRQEPPLSVASTSPARRSAPVRRKSQDRLSLGAISAFQGERGDAPLALRMSQTLGLAAEAGRETSPPQEALLNLERRLAERASEMSLSQYDTKRRLRELIDALEEARTIARQLPEGIELPVAAPLPVRSEQAPAAPLPDTAAAAPAVAAEPARQPTALISDGTRIGGIFLLLFGGASVLLLLWRRFNNPPPAKALPATPLSATGSSAELPEAASIFSPPLAAAAAREQEPIELELPRDTENAISVSHGFEEEYDDRFTAHLEAAEIMICFGRYQSAAGEVAEFILENPACGLRPRLALLDIYRRGIMKPEFERLAESLVARYNIAAPTMDAAPTTAKPARNLDSFPHIVARVTELWDRPDCLTYIQHLTTDRRDGKRAGFDMEAAEELALLESILQLRADQKASESATAA